MDHTSWRTAAQIATIEEQQLKAAKETYPELDFIRVFGGWEALPAGTPVIRAVDLDGIIEKLRERGA